MHRPLPLACLPLVAVLSACGGGNGEQNAVDALDAELTSLNTPDPAITAVLHEPIMVDPDLVGQANADAVRPPVQPYAGPVPADTVAAGSAVGTGETLESAPAPQPAAAGDAARTGALTLAELAGMNEGKAGPCVADIGYSATWAARLSPDLPLHPDARVTEAAGADRPECRLRVVSFTVSAPPQRMLDWYWTRAKRAGFAAEHRKTGAEHVLAGRKAGAGFLMTAAPLDGNRTAIDLVVTTSPAR